MAGANLQQVAERAGVSTATVSRVLNGNYPVREVTRKRVLAAVDALAYVPNAHGRALMTSRTGVVGVILHDVSDPFFSEIVRGLQRVAIDAGQLVMICNSLRDPEREVTYLESLRRQRVDAVVLVGGEIQDDAYIDALARHARGMAADGSRLVFCGRRVPAETPAAGGIVVDDLAASARMTRHLLDLGHHRIAYIRGPRELHTSQVRFQGFRQAMDDAGVGVDDALVIDGDFSRDGGYSALEQLRRSGHEFTAVQAANDLMAVGVLASLRDNGVRAPDHVSVAGFGDIPISRDVTPTLTTMHMPLETMGRRAMQLAVPSARAVAPSGELRFVPVELVVRASTGPARDR